ncbi:MAG TPA: glycoside hydrolase family 2 TIM barrel-domain containing protein [Acidobacteriota bacterium]|nr:glycoside hydrolase family 2 TIM barrel-domain containing protein [Acidobacteriota bacterium]
MWGSRAILLAGLLSCITFGSTAGVLASMKPSPPRQLVRLDGQWEMEQGDLGDVPPTTYSRTVPVPGLADMATPPFEEVGKRSSLRRAFWYRRTFTIDGDVPDVALLKVHKARYGTKVWLNGQLIGEHLPCFTPGYFDLKKALKGRKQPNELIIRIGADREVLPDGMPTGWDFEKYLFIPGIYDSVDLILTGAPYINNIQVAPDVDAGTVRIQAEIRGSREGSAADVRAVISEVASAAVVGSGGAQVQTRADSISKVDLTIPIENCRLWTPEAPYLYELHLTTGSDAARVRFGVRSFTFDPRTKRAILNGKPYYLRGSNVTIFRFFEDAERKDRPWREEWVRRLHRKFKTMNWNSLRYCIGFPPEMWYDIADEEGFLIQDEFPIWLLGEAPENPKAERIIPEYIEWMRERWNHPSVVIWDAQNESFTEETGKAVRAVRNVDLSNRPWENGWAEPQADTDCVEAHPYLFIRAWNDEKPFKISEMSGISGVPRLQEPQKKRSTAIIINEYAWLWLTRDGNPTCLTDKVYESLLGPNSTVDERRQLYARYLAALTEFWRAHRECAGVLHFCGLGYSRPGDKPRPEGGATSDHFVDLESLTFEPYFETFVKQAFNPLGLMLDFWFEEVAPGSLHDTKVFLINDLYEPWQGDVRVSILKDGEEIWSRASRCLVKGLGRNVPVFAVEFPKEPGEYLLQAELKDSVGKTIRSQRVFTVQAR